MADINLDNCVTIHTSEAVAKKFEVWKSIHKYGPYTLNLVPTGLNTAIKITQDITGHQFDLTDYESI